MHFCRRARVFVLSRSRSERRNKIRKPSDVSGGLQISLQIVACLFVCLAWCTVAACETTHTSGILAAETQWQTPYYTIDSGEDGPTLLIIGGIHGNEPAGFRAALQIRHWPIVKGKLIVLPGANSPGLKAKTRYLPGEPESHRDLNRSFPGDCVEEGARGEIALCIWRFVQEQHPDWILDLHEGHEFHVSHEPPEKKEKSIGSDGRQHVRDFVRNGGDYLGVCAGAYLCSAHYDWSLDLIATRVFTGSREIEGLGKKQMWYRGEPATVKMQLSSEGKRLFPQVPENVEVTYQNGPIVSPKDRPDLPPYTPLAYFRSEQVLYEPQRGTMIDTPAIVAGQFHEGRVIAISPHPEATDALHPIITESIRWLTGPSSRQTSFNSLWRSDNPCRWFHGAFFAIGYALSR